LYFKKNVIEVYLNLVQFVVLSDNVDHTKDSCNNEKH